MSATVCCKACGRIAFARVLEDDPSTNALEVEPDWKDEDQDEPVSCEHEEYEVIDLCYSDPFD